MAVQSGDTVSGARSAAAGRVRRAGPAAMLALLSVSAALGLLHLWSEQGGSIRRMAFVVAAYLAVPVGAYFASRMLRWSWLQVVAVTLAVLGIANSVVPFPEPQYFSLPPQLRHRVHVRGDTIIGISGVQEITTDQNGFRTTRRIDYANKPAGTYRIFAIGASTTAQMYLDDRRTWTHLLQETLQQSAGRAVEVINTGVSGLRVEHHYATARRVAGYWPDAYVFLIGVNDWNRQIREAHRDRASRGLLPFSETLLPRAIAFRKSTQDRDEPWRAAATASAPDASGWVEREDYGERYSRQNNALQTRTRRLEYRPTEVDPVYREQVVRLFTLCKERSIHCVFATQPSAYRPGISPAILRRLWMTPPGENYTLDLASLNHVASLYNGYLEQAVASDQSGQFRLCDLARVLPPTEAAFYDDVHFNDGGARLAAETLATCMTGLVSAH